jgi:hypothetical protein
MMKYHFFVFFCFLFMTIAARSYAQQTRPEQILGIVEELYQETLDSTIQPHHYDDPEYRKEGKTDSESIPAKSGQCRDMIPIRSR